jgi:hypothetical protein
MTSVSKREQFADQLRMAGWVGFWFELVLGAISLIIFLIAIVDPSFNINLRSSLGTVAVALGLIALGVSIYWMFYYIRLSRRLYGDDVGDRPKRDFIHQILNQGITIHFVGLLFSLIAAQIITSSLLIKVLTIPSGSAIYQSRQLMEPLDIFVTQSSLFMIASECFGLFITFWLLRRINGGAL